MAHFPSPLRLILFGLLLAQLAGAQEIVVPGRSCQRTEAPGLSALFDSAAVHQALGSVVPDSVGGQALLSATFTPSGLADRLRVLQTTLDSAATAAVTQVLASHLGDLKPDGSRGFVWWSPLEGVPPFG